MEYLWTSQVGILLLPNESSSGIKLFSIARWCFHYNIELGGGQQKIHSIDLYSCFVVSFIKRNKTIIEQI